MLVRTTVGGVRDKLIRWVEAEDRRFIASLDEGLAEAARRAGPHLACRIGCTDCCIGPFPITPLDARRLRRGLAELRALDPARADEVVRRAREATAIFGDVPDVDDEKFAERHAAVPCPALDPDSGACDLYAARPVSCRTFGPPVRIGNDEMAPCRLCFTEASAEEIEASRVTIDEVGDEHDLLDALVQSGSVAHSTLVAFALLSPDADR